LRRSSKVSYRHRTPPQFDLEDIDRAENSTSGNVPGFAKVNKV
jgi:hypothetical protein